LTSAVPPQAAPEAPTAAGASSGAPSEAPSEAPSGVRARPDLERLLEPISAQEPAGEALRYDPVYDRIKELRREDDPTLPQGVWQRELKRADWPGVAAECIAALSGRSKDLQLAAWLTEAWLRADGLPGLARGLELVAALVERFGAELHPRPFDDDEDAGAFALPERLAPVAWLDTALPDGLARLALSRPGAEDVPNRTWADWKHALYVENLAQNQPEAARSEGGVSRADFLAGVGLTPAAFYSGLAAAAASSLAALGALEAALDAAAGDEAPGFTTTRETLDAIGRFARRIAAERGEPAAPEPGSDAEPASPAPEDDEPDAEPAGAGGPAPRLGGPCRIASRDEAYRALSQAADFLLRVEPHSPVPYVVRRAVSWGGLSLAELYDELFAITDPKTVFRLLGIRGGDEA
jgi:type VI secretion system protein ImpA